MCLHTVLLWENLRIFPTFAYINQYVNALLLLAKVASIDVLSMDVRVYMLYFIRYDKILFMVAVSESNEVKT